MIRKKLMVKRLYNNPEVYYRKGAVSCLRSVDYENFLICVSNTIKNSEYYTKLLSYLEDKFYKEEIVSEPTQAIVLKLKKKYLEDKPAVIIAIGGGKVLDAAKVLRVLLDNPDLTFEDLESNQFCENCLTKLIAIPTTPSTGSEANSIAVIIDTNGNKFPYINQGFIPDMAILDHTFLSTIELPALYEFASDIFTHGYEGQVSVASSPLIQSIGKSCLAMLKSSFETLKKDTKDTKALGKVLYAGYLGGIVQGNAYVGVVHALAHTLEHQIEVSHGGSILPLIKPTILWSKKNKDNPLYDEFLEIYDSIGFEAYVNLDILKNIDKEKWIEDALKDPSISTNPIRMNKENLTELVNWILESK